MQLSMRQKDTSAAVDAARLKGIKLTVRQQTTLDIKSNSGLKK